MELPAVPARRASSVSVVPAGRRMAALECTGGPADRLSSDLPCWRRPRGPARRCQRGEYLKDDGSRAPIGPGRGGPPFTESPDQQLVDVTPHPIFARLHETSDRMTGLVGVPVGAPVL